MKLVDIDVTCYIALVCCFCLIVVLQSCYKADTGHYSQDTVEYNIKTGGMHE